jgi:glycosyltransferase involved in cell wall biosynthesis
MKILNVNRSVDPMGGGTAERTFQMSRFLSMRGADVTVLITDKNLNKDLVESLKPCKVVTIPIVNERFHIPTLFSLRLIDDFVSQADVIHLMAHWGFVNALVYWAARRLKKPYVVCPAGSFTPYGRSKYLKAIFDRVVGREMVRQAHGLIAVTEKEKQDFARYGVDLSRITVLPNAIDPDNFKDNRTREFRAKYKLESNQFILFLGRLNPIKGPDLLLNAFGRLSQTPYHLVLAGLDEGLQGQLEADAKRLGISERVHFVGHLARDEKSQALHACSVLAIPSRFEAMSIVALEAGATGTPVLLTDQCGFDEIEKIGGGFVVSASIEGLATGLDRIVKCDLQEMGTRLQTYCLEHFSWDSMVIKYLNTYQSILKSS